MSTLDLTEAVEAAASDRYTAQFPHAGTDWAHLPAMNKHLAREVMLPIVTAAAPLIEAQVREQVAREIEARTTTTAGSQAFRAGMDRAARIARGGAR